MKESIRAAREEVALRRQVAAVKELAGDERAEALDALSGPARYPEYNRLMQQEMIADILEDLAALGQSTEGSATELSFAFLTDEQRMALIDAGYMSDEAVQEVSDEDLEALPHIGKATVAKMRDALS